MVPQKNKDINAFSGLYDTYSPALYGVILKLTPDVQLASAILEQSFKKIWGELNDYSASKGRIFSLMLRIVLQECKTEAGFSNNIFTHLPVKKEHSTLLHQKMQGFFPDNLA
jgi:DNA-directed RNA polymerase specialized sigma24 family protein